MGVGWVGDPRGREYVYLELTHFVVQQKPAQHCKAIILQLKIIIIKEYYSEHPPRAWHCGVHDTRIM